MQPGDLKHNVWKPATGSPTRKYASFFPFCDWVFRLYKVGQLLYQNSQTNCTIQIFGEWRTGSGSKFFLDSKADSLGTCGQTPQSCTFSPLVCSTFSPLGCATLWCLSTNLIGTPSSPEMNWMNRSMRPMRLEPLSRFAIATLFGNVYICVYTYIYIYSYIYIYVHMWWFWLRWLILLKKWCSNSDLKSLVCCT